MIIDSLEKLSYYAKLNPLFEDVLTFIANNDLNGLAEGKHEIKGKDLFVNIALAKGKTREEAVMETHDEMIDIQIPLSCSETYGYTPREELPDAEYNAAKDLTLIPGAPVVEYVTCKPGMFAIFFPQDGHAPCISNEECIRKAIFKVKN
ncbi:MAG: YhcH/YjgK/YiaL family protein [Prevotella sp.]|nr:YhcH/YjgK/YiaL family protein [Prevotella sp.]